MDAMDVSEGSEAEAQTSQGVAGLFSLNFQRLAGSGLQAPMWAPAPSPASTHQQSPAYPPAPVFGMPCAPNKHAPAGSASFGPFGQPPTASAAFGSKPGELASQWPQYPNVGGPLTNPFGGPLPACLGFRGPTGVFGQPQQHNFHFGGPASNAASQPQQQDRDIFAAEPVKVVIARAIMKQASQLPLSRRHELLAAAAQAPALAAVFQAGEQPVPAVKGLQALLQALAERVCTAPPAAAPVAAGGAASEALGAGQAVANEALGALRLSAVPEYEQYGVSEGEVVRAVISVKAAAEVLQRAHVALTCVLDRSGSMDGDRIGLVRETCHFLIDQLSPNDYLGLLSYAGDVREDLPLLRMTPEGRKLAHLVVEALQANGSTALYDGLEAGVRQQMQAERELQGAAESRVVHSCFLFTDGQATDGRKTSEEIVAGLQVLQAPTDQHVTVHTFGFGAGHSVQLLQAVADAQSGIYYFIRTSEDIATGFGDALGGLLSVVAKDVRIGIRPTPAAALTAFRSGGRMLGGAASAPVARAPSRCTGGTSFAQGPSSFVPAFGAVFLQPAPKAKAAAQAPAVTAAAGAAAAVVPTAAAFNDMFAEESRECLAVLSAHAAGAGAGGAAAAAAAAAEVLAEVDLEYTDAASGLRVQRTVALQVVRSPAPRPEGQLPAVLVFVTVCRFETLDAIEAAQRAAEEGDGLDVSGPHRLLDAHLARLAAAPLKSPGLEALAEQTRVARESIRPRAQFDQAGTAGRANVVQSLKQQRVGTSTFASPQYMAQYDVKAKRGFRMASATANEVYNSKKSGN